MAGKRHNKKLPKDGISDKKVEPKYGYVHGEWNACGGHTLHYVNPDEHEKTYSETLTPSCSYQTVEHDSEDKQIATSLFPGEHRGYYGGGKSTHSDSHLDTNSEATIRQESAGDTAVATATNGLFGFGQAKVEIKGRSSSVVAEGSDGVHDMSSTGTYRRKAKKNDYLHVEGDKVTMVEKNSIVVAKQDAAHYVGQNWDTYVKTKGKLETGEDMKLKSGAKITQDAKGDFEITSESKIIIKVGQSTITIQDGSIEIKGAEIKITGDGTVDIRGATTNMQGGGPTLPPVSFK